MSVDIKVDKIAESRIDTFDATNFVFGKVYSDHMFTADYVGGRWQDLRIEPYEAISLKPALAALHYGQSIFEGMKAYLHADGSVALFRPEMNFERLNRSLDRMCMPQISHEMFFSALKELLNLDKAWIPNVPNTSLYIRPFVFASDEYIGVKISERYKFMIFTCPVGAYYEQPLKVKFETTYSRAASGGTGSAKTAGNYAATYKAFEVAKQEGYDQVIWTDNNQHIEIEECGTMNVMFVIDGTLVTAPLSDCILPGVTRDSVISLAKDWNMPVEERKITVDEVIQAIQDLRLQEAFGVGTAAIVTPFAEIAHQGKSHALPDASPDNFSQKASQTLKGIYYGELEDKFAWMKSIA